MFSKSAFYLLVSLASLGSGDQCVSKYDGQICANYVNHTFFLDNDTTTAMVEKSLSEAVLLQQRLGPEHPTCIAEYMKWACGRYFPVCKGNVVYYPCKSQCERVIAECQVPFSEINKQDQLPQCGNTIPPFNVHYQADPKDCVVLSPLTSVSSSSAFTSESPTKCNPPLIPDPHHPGGTADHRSCFAGCCVPCPSNDLFYTEGKASTGETITATIRGISFCLSLFVFTSFAVLPGRRTHPAAIILYLSLATLLSSGLAFFTIKDKRAVQCSENGITRATMENNSLCGFQGAYLIFSAFAVVLWSTVLIVHLHVHTVWNSFILERKYLWIHLISWGVPAAITIISLAFGHIDYEFGSFCRVTFKSSNALFFYPLALVIFSAFLLHAWTVVHILRVMASNPISDPYLQMSHRSHVAKAVLQQGRSVVLAAVLLCTFLFDWVFWFTQTARLTSDSVEKRTALALWSVCLQDGNGQDACSDVIAEFAPTLEAMVAAEGLAAAVGIWIFIFFGLETRVFYDWKEYFRGIAGLKKKNSTENLQRSFLAI